MSKQLPLPTASRTALKATGSADRTGFRFRQGEDIPGGFAIFIGLVVLSGLKVGIGVERPGGNDQGVRGVKDPFRFTFVLALTVPFLSLAVSPDSDSKPLAAVGCSKCRQQQEVAPPCGQPNCQQKNCPQQQPGQPVPNCAECPNKDCPQKGAAAPCANCPNQPPAPPQQ